MNLCWIKAGGFVPLDYGGRIRSYHMLRELARRHSVSVVTFYPEIADDPHPQLAPLFDELVLIPLTLPRRGSMAEYLDYIRLFAAPHAYSMQKYYRPEVRQAVKDLFTGRSFDAIICDFIFPAGLLEWPGRTPIVLFTHNFEAEVWERQYEVSRNPVNKLKFWLEYRRLAASERRYAGLAAHVLAVSESNRQFFARYAGPENVTLLPTGVDTEYFQPAPELEQEKTLVFTGAMDWLPNYDAMEWFYSDILPVIRISEPDVETWMVGRNPPASLQSLVEADSRVHLTGRVEDVRPYMHRGSVFVLPMRSGSGTRLKVFEAMAAGKAIVSTSTGAEGLPVMDGQNIVLADDPQQFAGHVVRLLRDRGFRAQLGRNARELAEAGLSWRAATDKLEEAVLRAVQGREALAGSR